MATPITFADPDVLFLDEKLQELAKLLDWKFGSDREPKSEAEISYDRWVIEENLFDFRRACAVSFKDCRHRPATRYLIRTIYRQFRAITDEAYETSNDWYFSRVPMVAHQLQVLMRLSVYELDMVGI